MIDVPKRNLNYKKYSLSYPPAVSPELFFDLGIETADKKWNKAVFIKETSQSTYITNAEHVIWDDKVLDWEANKLSIRFGDITFKAGTTIKIKIINMINPPNMKRLLAPFSSAIMTNRNRD